MATLVKFRNDKLGGVFAFFPQLVFSFNGYRKNHTKTGRTREITLLSHDLKEYHLTGYSTRVIFRKELNTVTA